MVSVIVGLTPSCARRVVAAAVMIALAVGTGAGYIVAFSARATLIRHFGGLVLLLLCFGGWWECLLKWVAAVWKYELEEESLVL